ncbi:MAG: hypothetical protein AB7O98_03085 [Hyphomonadaceae bacterium]
MAENRTFDIYRLMVEEVRETKRARRELSNVFMTLNLAGVGALGFLARGDEIGRLNPVLFSLCAIALALTCIIWRTSNSYYTLLLAAKYKTIYALEEELGAHPMRDEYDTLMGKRRTMKWFTLERAMPLMFIIGYALFFAVQVGALDLPALWMQARDGVANLLQR